MIKTTDVLNAINRELVKNFNYTVYIDTMPEDFERPSFFIGLLKESNTDKNISTVERTKQFKIICYDKKDESYNSDTLSIFKMTEDACYIFSSGKLEVGDRKINISTDITTDKDLDIMYIDVTVKFFDDRGIKAEDEETMENLAVGTNFK